MNYPPPIPALAERLTAALEQLRGNVRDMVSQALLLYGREEAENLRNEIYATHRCRRLNVARWSRCGF